jgi:cell division protein FtsB
LFNGFCRLYFRLRAALLHFGFHCISLHVSAYMAETGSKKEQADKHTRKETTKITKENRENTQMETCRV